MFNAREFLENEGLYSPCEISIEDLEELTILDNETIKISIFCASCGEQRVFSVIPKPAEEDRTPRFQVEHNVFTPQDETKKRRFERVRLNLESRHLRFFCAYDNNHNFEVLITTISGPPDSIMKIGQYPSIADIEKPYLKKYTSVLPKEYLNEYSKALGLFSHGIGIGSFVYLRRIFEKLVLDAFKSAETEGALTQDDFDFIDDKKHQRRMEDKIKLLNGYLPDVIIENAGIYGVLSKGIHELSEEECLRYFPAIETGIQIMLDAYLVKKEREKRDVLFSKQIGEIKGEIK